MMSDEPFGLWSPTAEQFKKYADREVELCLLALRQDPHLRQNQSLFSIHTWELAMRERERRVVLEDAA